MTKVPMNTPRVCNRITAYHKVLASRSPRTGCQGRGGRSAEAMTPSATSRFRVAI